MSEWRPTFKDHVNRCGSFRAGLLVATAAAALLPRALHIEAQQQSETGLVLHYTFDEGNGSLVSDSSGHGNDGRLHGPEFVKVENGYALRFDGVDDYVDCGAGESLDITDAISVEAWLFPEQVPAREMRILGKEMASYALSYYYDGGRIGWYVSNGGNYPDPSESLRTILVLGV